MSRPTVLERAFELADQGFTHRDIRQMIAREGYDPWQIYGSVVKQLSIRIKAAQEKKLR